ncbi:MAG: NAD(P)H-binding protein [Lachnospiraceae bacterium]|jgi:uncharacterized protein YbjT (DUF2867 family)|nr:NAD(P)H-binding protein [Lachnospiraceae bacterium]
MKIVLAGACGKLGSDILRALIREGHEVTAADVVDRDVEGADRSRYVFRKLDVTDAPSLKGLCDGADAVITTVGLTGVSAQLTNYDIDYRGNLNLLNEAVRAGVRKFVYISVLHADTAPEEVPMCYAKKLMEAELVKSGIPYVIHRPSGYFYDIVKVFRPMIEKGKVTLLGKKPVSANVVDTPDFADFILEHLSDQNAVYNVGGKETWTYEEIARMCFEAAGKEPQISTAPPWLFDVLANLPKNKKNGKQPIIRFSKWTLSNDMVGDTKVGSHSFKEYIHDSFAGGGK